MQCLWIVIIVLEIHFSSKLLDQITRIITECSVNLSTQHNTHAHPKDGAREKEMKKNGHKCYGPLMVVHNFEP